MGDTAAAGGRLAARVHRELPRPPAQLHVRDPRARARRAARDEHRPGPLPDGDDVHVAGRWRRRDTDDDAQPRRALRLREGRRAGDGARDEARDGKGPGAPPPDSGRPTVTPDTLRWTTEDAHRAPHWRPRGAAPALRAGRGLPRRA